MNIDALYNILKNALKHTVPNNEIRRKAELADEILRLKTEKNAVILGHNYMEPALFLTIPDFTGDSLELSRKAAETDKDVIVFCGVKFMAETAKILNPEKVVLAPSLDAGCSLAESITADDVRALKQRFPGVPVVTYINTYADVKAECDACCTSGNAAEVMASFDSERVIFLPDEFLARNTANGIGKTILFPHELDAAGSQNMPGDYQVIGWRGHCEVHEKLSASDIEELRRDSPDAAIVTHPECPPEVAQAVDFCGGTTAMIRFVEQTAHPSYIILTECAMADNIAALYPQKTILPVCRARCPHMNLITLETTLAALRKMQHAIDVPEDIRLRAFRSVERMLEIR